ncbi:ester cyclase [Pantoea sp.]|uniref:ester cyclase n=1 Tax=Pantoea sp. TaxID=69393 RepID=UPI0031D5E90D
MSEQNKAAVRHFNHRVIAQGDREAFDQLVAENFVNHSAPAGASNDREALWHTFAQILRPALSDLQVEIHQQIAEGDWVNTRKTITGVHSGALMGIAPTGSAVTIEVMDMVRIENGQYVEHWGINTLAAVVSQLRSIS